MNPEDSRHLAESLSVTIKQVEQQSGLGRDNPDVAELKRIVSRKIADLETTKTAENTPEP